MPRRKEPEEVILTEGLSQYALQQCEASAPLRFDRANPVADNLPKPDTNLRGLYKAEDRRTVVGKTLRYLIPDEVQWALSVQAIVLAMQDELSTPDSRDRMSRGELEAKCFELLAEIEKSPETPEQKIRQNKLAARLSFHPVANTLYCTMIRQSFPDIPDPENLTSNARQEMISIIMKDLQKMQEGSL